ncbi:trypsin-like peptidase domain-containing protein [Bifidobacterium sp. ESL0798]|uniref:trypsin-like peptidase domain-containing protein n=1 Tax=Bifidobacterium sp. ESL0798 TaxID=2983235 RepID=UPI0023F9FD1C|nr:trypsin-like peptidase domain-containing protein [Bifidobacterium sp. ESL0798]WEV73972.1 trypsin-like peptidase domain-containing protein [Bifidobacterium sp. ESL0798]
MAEDNKDEWGSGQPARPNEDMNAMPDLPDFVSNDQLHGASESDNRDTDYAGATTTSNDTAALGSTQPIATQPVTTSDTGNFNGATNDSSNSTPTEVFTTGYRPDDANSTANVSGASPSNNPYETSNTPNSTASSTSGPYRPAPEYGAYGPLPDHIGNGYGNNYGNNNAPFGSGNAAGSNGPANTPAMPWNGIFGSNGQNPNAGQNDNGGNENNNDFGTSYGPYNAGPGQPQGPNSGNFDGPNMPNGGNGYGYAQPKSHSNVVTAIVAAVVTAALCLGIGFLGISKGWVTVPTSSSISGITSNKSGSGTANVKGGQAPDWAGVSSKVSNSVVSITTQVSQGIAKGSGAILDTKGHIVTNNHVVSGGQNIQVTLSNGQMYKASVVGADSTTDLAVLQLQNAPSDLKPVEFADSSKLAVGESVMAVGNPLGYDDTATTGIVSALNRPVSVMDDNNSEIVTNAVQIDAAINPGNSGGPTFDAGGQVIGINSSIASASSSSGQSGSIGIGFAIPSNLVKRVADEIVEKGSVQHAMLGVTIKSANVESDGITRGGAQITTPSTGGSAVVKGSPADKAGLKADDTIVAFNGQAVGSSSALLGYVRASALGDKVKLTLVRGGKTMDVEVTLDQKESDVKGSNRSETQKQNGSNGQNGQGQNGQSQNGDGSGNSDGDGGGLFDPFGLW